MAGTVEALHVNVFASDDIFGPRATRVATTAAASYVAASTRHKDGDRAKRREVIEDVAAGLLVGLVVYGSGRDTQNEEDGTGRRGRRWSF